MAVVSTFEVEERTGIRENNFNCSSLDTGESLDVLYQYPVYLSQIVASWTTSSTVTVSIEYPSGMSFTVKAYSGTTSLTLNSLDGSNSYIYWLKLPAGTRVRFSVSVDNITNFKTSIISNSLS